jgi:hypothetical protein
MPPPLQQPQPAPEAAQALTGSPSPQQRGTDSTLVPALPAVVLVEAPEGASQALAHLQADHTALLASLPEGDRAPGSPLASAPLWDPAPAEQLLAALGTEGGGARSKRRAQALVALLLLAQAASALLDAGARPAALFMRHMLGQLPTLAPLVAKGVVALEEATAAAERRCGWDHPKQPVLRWLLAQAASADQVRIG